MEASALTIASRRGLLARRSPLLRLQRDERLVALIRSGHDRAFEALFDRYQARLLAFCRHLLGSPQDAEDMLQEVFANAHAAMLADHRPINARPWLYRIARNRCLNHLRRPVAEGQDSMDVHPHENGASTLEHVQHREELRQIFADVRELPETQRTALVLREMDDLSYTEIAEAMGSTLPAVKSLLVRARMSLAEASEARVLTCDEVRLELAEAAEGLAKLSGSARRHVRDCAGCRRYRRELRSSTKALAGLAPFGLLAFFRELFGTRLGGSGAAAESAGSAGSAGGVAAAGGSGATLGGATAAVGGAAGGIGGALGAKAAIGMATAALLTAGAVGMDRLHDANSAAPPDSPAAAPHRSTGGVEYKRDTGGDRQHAGAGLAPQANPTQSNDAALPQEAPPAPALDPSNTQQVYDAADGTSGGGGGGLVGGSSAGGRVSAGGITVGLPHGDPPPSPPAQPSDGLHAPDLGGLARNLVGSLVSRSR